MLKSIQQSLILSLCALSPAMAVAATLNEDEAKKVAAEFFQSGEVSRLGSADAFTLAYVAKDEAKKPVSYVFNAKDGKGFVIVSADSDALPVLGYSDSSTWEAGSLPGLAEEYISTTVPGGADNRRIFRTARAAQSNVLLPTPEWSQEAPFNNNIPNRRLTGCVGVAVAEIMKYHNFPAARPTSLIELGQAADYRWGTMRTDNYRSGYTADEAAAVATLVADAAIAIGTDFGLSSSSAFEVKVPYALSSLFGYDAGISYKKRDEMDKASWDALLVNELSEGRPVLYCGQDVTAGHAFVADGYEMRGNVPYFHINWGWGGSANGYYASDALNPVVSKAHSYNNLMTVVYNIKPSASSVLSWSPIHVTSDERQVGLTIDTDDISSVASFTLRVGALKNISNSDFSGKLAVALFGADGKQKCLLADARNFKLISMQISKYVDYTCKLPAGVSVAAGDVVRMVTQVADGAEWLPVAGDNMLSPGEALAKGGTLPYVDIIFPTGNEYVEIDGGAGRVIKGRDYQFKLVPTSPDKVVTVKANGFILTPNAANVYTLTNVLAEQEITVNVQNAADVLTKSVLWVTSGNLKNLLDDNQTSSIKDLTLFGTINAEDIAFIRERMKLTRLDISQCSITASGANPANALPTKGFMGYRSLQQIILPGNLTTFKNGCLAQTGLRSIDIPASVATWEYNVFVGCNQLREVIARRATAAWVNWCVFSGVPQDKLIVPVGAAASYRAKEYWADFKVIEEGVPAAPTTFAVTVAEQKGLSFTYLTEGTEFSKGAAFDFKVEADATYEDAIMQVYCNATLLKADINGVYHATINGNSLIHVEFKNATETTVDKQWKLTGDEGGIGLVSSVVNVPFGQTFTVRANAIKVPGGDNAVKVYCIVLTDKEGRIKEFISPQVQNYSGAGGNLKYNFNCQVKEATIREGNQIRLATSFDKKNWTLVEGENETITDRLEAIGNPVIYHKVTMPSSVTGAKIEGSATEVVRGMPFTVKVSAINPAQRVTVAVNNEVKASKVLNATVSLSAVLEDLDITILVQDADAGDYQVFNIQEGKLAEALVNCPARVKLVGTMLVSEFAAIRANNTKIIDLDMADVTIKGAMMTGNSIPENAFAAVTPPTLPALKTIILPNNLERIDKNAFYRCMQLTELTIPANVSYIGDNAFTYCTKLTKITAKPTTAPVLGSMSPFPSTAANITLVVPKGSETSYTTTSYWSRLKLYQAPADQKDKYWVKFDPTRVAISGNNKSTTVEVGQSEVQMMLTLPNNQSPGNYGGDEVMRPGVIFQLYDNGIDVFKNLGAYNYQVSQYNTATPEQSWSMVGGRLILRWVPSSTSGHTKPQNHEIDVVFYYTLKFENGQGAQGITGEILDVPEEDVLRDVKMARYQYQDGRVMNTKVEPIVYKEGLPYKFRLSDPGPKTALVVKAISNVCVKPDRKPVYEEREMILEPEFGVYTLPALEGDTRIVITGVTHYEEGDPIPADDLYTVNTEEAQEFTELIVTGEMNENDFETVREKFENIETIDLSQIKNEVIPADAFAGMENLRTIIVPETVTEIGEGAFQGCDKIETLTLPGVNAIGEGAFEGCSNLKSILIPSSDTATEPTVAEAPVKRIRRVGARNTAGITAESFRGLNPNCLIYIGSQEIPDSEALNIILNRDGSRVAASDIILDGNHAFNAPASFNLGEYKISFTVDIPGSLGSDDNDGWKGIILPFTPTKMEYGVEFAERPGSGITLMSFDDENAEAMTKQTSIVANRPYMANVAAPYASVPVTFYAKGVEHEDNTTFDVPYTPVPEENVAAGKHFSLYGSFDGETVIGTVYALDDTADAFVRPADGGEVNVNIFEAYLCANDGVAEAEHTIGEHPLWIFDPAASGAFGTKLYRNHKVEMASLTTQADIYYTTDGTDPTVADGSRKLYEAPFALEGEKMALNVVAEYRGQLSDVVALDFELKKTDINYDLAKNWNWISHNMEEAVPVADFADNDLSRVLSQTDEAVLDPKFGIVGTLTALDPAVAYKVCVASEGWNGNVSGVAYDPTGTVTLNKGWNWIGSPVDDASQLVADLLSNLEAEEGDMIVGLEGFTQANAEGAWQGTLERLVPGVGYMYFSNSDKEFTYALLPVAEEVKVAERAAAEETPWAVDIHRYSSVMPVTAVVTGAGKGEYAVGAFCGDECRGIGVNVGGTVMINVHGELGDVISFRFLSGSEELRSVKSVGFAEEPVGTIADPMELNLAGTVAVEAVEGANGYVVIGENGSVSVEGNLADVVAVEVYDLAGNKLAESGKAADGSLRVSDLEAGVRIILVRTTDSCIYRKLMVK